MTCTLLGLLLLTMASQPVAEHRFDAPLSFNGVDQSVPMGDINEVLKTNTAITLEAWIYPRATGPNEPGIVGEGGETELLADGHTVRFTAWTGFEGVAQFWYATYDEQGEDAWAAVDIEVQLSPVDAAAAAWCEGGAELCEVATG